MLFIWSTARGLLRTQQALVIFKQYTIDFYHIVLLSFNVVLDDEIGNLMTLELIAPDQRQAVRLGKLFERKAETVYNLIMTELLDDEDAVN